MLNKLFIVSGTSGSEKKAIMRANMNNEIVSFTTRAKREGEIEAKDYYYITLPEFEHLLETDALVEVTSIQGNFYGVTKTEFETKLNKETAFLIVNYNGMKQIKKNYHNCTTIFIYCDKSICEKNMELRGENNVSIAEKLTLFEQEVENLYYYDYVVSNKLGEISNVIDDVKDIIFDI